jgi:phage repressor protein C with HTH and peptisase S24 domain
VIQLWEADQHGHLLGLVKQFVKQDAESVTVRQFNPEQEFTFPRDRVKQVNKVVHIDKL